MNEHPDAVPVRVRDIRPYHWGQWCTVNGGEPFVNRLLSARWSEDGEHLWFMLDSRNFLKAGADEVVDLVPMDPGDFGAEKYGEESGWSMDNAPSDPKSCPTCERHGW